MQDTEGSLQAVKYRIANLFVTSDMSDCEFEFPNKVKVKAHKTVLGSASPVFKAMFFGELAGEKPQKIEGIEPTVFKKMLEYLYTDNVEFDTVEMACLVYAAGERYILPKLKNHCEEYILLNINESSVFEILELFKLFDNKNIKDECCAFIRSETKTLLNSEMFLQIDINILKTLVEQPALNIDSEIEVFSAIEKWVTNKAEEKGDTIKNMVPLLTDVMSNVRFLAMGSEEFARGPGISSLLKTQERLELLLNINAPGICRIPKNFCSLRKPRPTRKSFMHTFQSITSLSTSRVNSPEFKMGSLSWMLHVVGKYQNSTCTHAIFSVTFKGNSQNASASCSASIEINLLAQKKGYQNFKTNFKQTFGPGEDSWNNPHSIEWSKLMDKQSAFIVDNTITVKVSIEPDAEPEDKEPSK